VIIKHSAAVHLRTHQNLHSISQLIPLLKANVHVMFPYYTLQPEVYCKIRVTHSNFRHQAFPRMSPRESTQQWKAELWARNVRKFCLYAEFHVTFRDLLHAVQLRHGTDGFTSPLKEDVLRIFCRKNPTASAGCEPANLGTRGQHATSRPLKPLS
jgi:hypothetical protein